MRTPRPLPLALQNAAFSTAAARELGLTARRLRARDLAVPFRGVRSSGRPRSLAELAAAYAARMPSTQLFSHTTAARLHGMRMPRGFRESVLHVTAVHPAKPPEVAGVVGHSSRTPLPTRFVDGLRSVAPVVAWMQSASLLSVTELVVMGDGLVRRRSPLATMDELRDAVGRSRGMRGIRRLRLALELVRPGTDSGPETELRLDVVAWRFPEPRVNSVIHNEFGQVIAHGDLEFEEYGVVLEYDGDHHFEDARQYRIDVERLDLIAETGRRVIRVDKYLMARPGELQRRIETALTERGWRAP